MSGHSKWSTIKHKKAVTDAKRANVFTKLAKDVTLAAREGGGDPEMNFRLRMAMEKAKGANMPKENIERAIKRGMGELKDGMQIEEVVYEAYGPGQVALLIKTATDNKNRTLSEVKNILQKNGGKFVEGGGVAWQFEPVGMIGGVWEDQSGGQESLEMEIIESGASNYEWNENKEIIIYTPPKDLQKVKEAMEKTGLKIELAELGYQAKNKVAIDEKITEALDQLLEALDENDDVAEIFDNRAD